MLNKLGIIVEAGVMENIIVLPNPHLNAQYDIQIDFPPRIITPAYSIENKTVTGFTILFASPLIQDFSIHITTCDTEDVFSCPFENNWSEKLEVTNGNSLEITDSAMEHMQNDIAAIDMYLRDHRQKIENRLDRMERVLEEMMQEISALGRKMERF